MRNEGGGLMGFMTALEIWNIIWISPAVFYQRHPTFLLPSFHPKGSLSLSSLSAGRRTPFPQRGKLP